MLRTIQSVFLNMILLTVPSVLVLLLLLELFCRYLLPTSDVPVTGFFDPIGNHYLPNQNGTYIKGINSNIIGVYRINANGWNSPVDYKTKKDRGIYRIAVIGDSYVEALQVNSEKSFPYLLEAGLNAAGPCRVEVYSYGHSGANLVQYLNVLRNRVVQASPDLVIYNVIHNDFQESLLGYARQDNWSIRIDGDSISEVPPRPLVTLKLKQALSRSALVRYSIINLDLGARIFNLNSFIGILPQNFESNVNASNELLNDNRKLHQILRYILRESEQLAQTHGFKMIWVIDTDRMAIYSNKDPRMSMAYRFNDALQSETSKFGMFFIDLTESFLQSWKTNRKPFNWTIDYHWNRVGHEIAAKELNKTINSKVRPDCNLEVQ